MPERPPPGDALTQRLAARTGAGLSRRSMPDGGEVYTGPLARRALKTLGARAMTMDRTIFVDPDFDPRKPDDAALYAHERHHEMESGGSDGAHGPRDAEEIHARGIERMVLHRLEAGEELSTILHDVTTGAAASEVRTGGGAGAELVAKELFGGDKDRDPMLAYQAMRAEGKTHRQIVEELMRHVIERLQHAEEDRKWRRAGQDG